MSDLAPFAAALIRLREFRGLTQYALGKAAGLDGIAVARMERGERAPSLATAAKLADALGCSLDELCGRDETTRPA